MMERFMYWAPWKVTQPWKPKFFWGGDEWHNKSAALKLPFLGCFIFFYEKDFNRDGEEHLHGLTRNDDGTIDTDGEVVDGCEVCQDIMEDWHQYMSQNWPVDDLLPQETLDELTRDYMSASCILTEADILAGRDDDCTMHDHHEEPFTEQN